MKKATIFEFIVLTLRWYLAVYMINYGYGKLIGGQFGVFDPTILNKPVHSVDKFYLAWHLFSLDRSFDVIIGLMQVLGGILIVIDNTALLGAIFLLPILGNIFLIDFAFTRNIHGYSLVIRLLCMIISDIIIIYFYKDKIKAIWKILMEKSVSSLQYKWFWFVFLPIIGFLWDIIWGLLSYPFQLLLEGLDRG